MSLLFQTHIVEKYLLLHRTSLTLRSAIPVVKSLKPIRHERASIQRYTIQSTSRSNTIAHQASSRASDRLGRTWSSITNPVESEFTQNTSRTRDMSSTKAMGTTEPIVHDEFESKTGTWQYVIADPSTLTAVIIDPVLDYDASRNAISTETPDALLSLVQNKGYTISMILETHAHADHLSGASYLQSRLGKIQTQKPPIGIGKRIARVQEVFGARYGIAKADYENAFDKLMDDDEVFQIGKLEATAIHLPGHTPDHMGYKIGDNIFCGDLLFHVDIGTARTDFPGGSATDIYNSARRVLEMPDNVKVWTGHDYPHSDRNAVSCLTVREHREKNSYVKDGITEQDFVIMRHKRDEILAEPKLIHQSLQVNIRAGQLPVPSELGQRLLHLPLKLQGVNW